ncbi:uncharacterized protein LOC108249155 [Kryptolebias marmoratus]|uniref:uncharacterized protein LOC108249155 n=1 Tax=Kryptolebias marmoratus TaxID=37003 RepID=UPI000D530509|nr:uncharacterized protein LOC108249155 [Kryptolebias marmoratus]
MFFLSVILLQVSQASAVEVTEGVDSVLLPCQVSDSVSSESTVVWSREDLKISTVHIRQRSGDDFGEQNQRYSERTQMRPDALQSGDLSLTLRTPTVSDSEVYTCTVRRSGQELSRISVPLKVTEPPPLWPKVVFPVLVVLSVLAAAVGVFFYCRYKTVKLNPAYKLQLVSVTEGQQYVLLPCKTKTRLPLDATVEWRRIDEDRVVYMYAMDQKLPDEEDENYQLPRTSMSRNPLRTGDLSLTLLQPCRDDNDLYVCTVQRDELVLKQRVVALTVKGGSVVDGDVDSDRDPLQEARIMNWVFSGITRQKDTLRRSLRSSRRNSVGPSSENRPSTPSSIKDDSDSAGA